MEEVAYLVGDFEELDKASLPGLGPIRVKVSCKDPKEIKGASKVYFNNRGFMVSWLVETEKTQNLKNKSTAPPEPKEDEEEEEESDHYFPFKDDGPQTDASGQPPESSKQGESRFKQKSVQGEKPSEELHDQQNKEVSGSAQKMMFQPSGGTMMVEGGHEVQQMELCIDSEEQILMQSQSSEAMLEDPINKNGVVSVQEEEGIRISHPKQASLVPMQAERKSTRIGESTTPVQEKAAKIKARKNLQGISNNPYTILQSISNSHLAKIAEECNLELGDDEGEIDGLIDILKAKELAQAEIFRLEKAKSAKQEAVIVEEVTDSDDEGPEGHAVIVEELTKMTNDATDDPLLVVGKSNKETGKGKKKAKFK